MRKRHQRLPYPYSNETMTIAGDVNVKLDVIFFKLMNLLPERKANKTEKVLEMKVFKKQSITAAIQTRAIKYR